jgi:four helix bundle protein
VRDRVLALSTRLLETVPRGNGPLVDQLRRAALSVPLNIAEAAGRTTQADGGRHYAIARGAAMECAAIIDAMHVLRIIDDPSHVQASAVLARIVAMTTKLCR